MLNKIPANVLALSLAALGLVVLSERAAAQSWQLVTNASGGFTVQMPGTPRQHSEMAGTAAVPTRIHLTTYETPDKREAFIVSYNDYPSSVDLSNTKQILAGVRRSQTRDAQVIADRPTCSDGRRGSYVEVITKDGQLSATRSFLAGNRLYQVGYINRDGELTKSGSTFLMSFNITQ